MTPLDRAQQALEHSVWAAIHQGRAELQASRAHPDGAMTIAMRLPLAGTGAGADGSPPRLGRVAVQEIDGWVSGLRVDAGDQAPFSVQYETNRPAASTVTRLAAQSSSAELAQAATRSHNPQDVSGGPLPSGDSVDSQAPTASSQLSRRAQAILLVVPATEGMTPQQHFDAMLQARNDDPSRRNWTVEHMIEASGTGRTFAYRANWIRRAESPRTRAVRAFLQTAAPEPLADVPGQNDARFLSVLRENDRLEPGKGWPLASMARGADTTLGRARYLKREHEASKQPDSPRSEAMLDHLDNTKPAGRKRDTKSDRFLRAIDRDKQLPAERKLHFDRLAQLVGLASSDARRALRSRQELSAPDSQTVIDIRAFMDATEPLTGRDSKGKRFDRATEESKKRPPNETWDEADIRKAAGLTENSLRNKRRVLARATEAAAGDPEPPEPPASSAGPTNPP